MVAPLTHDYLLGAYNALFEDIIRWIPTADRRLIERDKTLLKNLLETRGLRYFTIDLPEASKAFERCLADGSLVLIKVPGFGMARHHGRKDRRPRLFWVLWSRVFHTSGSLRESPCTTSIYFLRQLMRLFAKYREDCADAYKYAAVRDFCEIEQGLPEPSLDWEDTDNPYSHSSRLHTRDFSDSNDYYQWSYGCVSRWNGFRPRTEHFQQVFDLLVALMPELDIYSLRGRHGPGAVSDGKGIRSKFEFPIWTDKLQSVFPFDWFGSSKLSFGELFPSSGVAHSKLICVPKSAKGPRLIASEPICNQWIQQALMAWFLDYFNSSPLTRGSINIKDQSISQQYARIASNGDLATVDLKSASDRLTCRLVERVFRRKPDLLSAMMACRTSLLHQDIDKMSPKWVELRKFSTQGSALTFPVQSFVFFAISIACVLWTHKMDVNIENVKKAREKVVVYGDDIIIDISAYKELIDALHQLGLKVNESKSFGTGLFRESCGSDWYNGVDVTPSFITSDFDRSSPTTIASVLEASNNFYKKGCWILSDYLVQRVPGKLRSRIPVENGTVAIKGLFSYHGCNFSFLRKRYNSILMREEYLVSYLHGKISGFRPDGILRLRQYFTERPNPDIVWDPVSFSRSTPIMKTGFKSLY